MDYGQILLSVDVTDAGTEGRDTWLRLSMAAKAAGVPYEIWDEWCRGDPYRYHEGKNRKVWDSISPDEGITAGTLVQYARDHGYWSEAGHPIEDYIQYDGDELQSPRRSKSATEQAAQYLETLFKPEDVVGYNLQAEYDDKRDKWTPCTAGSYHYTAGQILADLRSHPDDIGYALGDPNPEAGGWIRMNPLDGKGANDRNVTEYRYALIESDDMPADEQLAWLRDSGLPLAAMVDSGGKSIHGIVRIDAGTDRKLYDKRVAELYDWCAKHGFAVDTQDKNPSRLSRFPGLKRKGREQRLVGVNVGPASWDEWQKALRAQAYDLPEIESFAAWIENPPKPKPLLINGLLRKGAKMMIAAPSKAGKSLLMARLAVDLATGGTFMDAHQCTRNKVLYINGEIEKGEFSERLDAVIEALGADRESLRDTLMIWNLRGHAAPLEKLVAETQFIQMIRDAGVDAVLLDPLYKFECGDENSAADAAKLTNAIDRVINETGASCIYSHHFGKGNSMAKYDDPLDRSVGSGAWGRDVDAYISLTPVKRIVPENGAPIGEDDEIIEDAPPTERIFKVDHVLRAFATPEPYYVAFDYPLHRIVSDEVLNPPKEPKPIGRKEYCTIERAIAAYDTLAAEYDEVTVDMLSEALEYSKNSLIQKIKTTWKTTFKRTKNTVTKCQ